MGSYDPEMDGYTPPEISLKQLRVGHKIGEGSFSEVYQGIVVVDDGDSDDIPVIAKAYKKTVRGRDWFSFYCDERTVCRRLSETNCPGVAPFLGVCGSDAYLVWEDVGTKTIESCLKGDVASAFELIQSVLNGEASSSSLDQTERTRLFKKIAKGLIHATMSVHRENVVHRDVKPDNVLLSPNSTNSVLLIDLGGACDFETGVGSDPSETIFDPTYGAPEQFIRDMSVKKKGGVFSGLMSKVTGDDVNAMGLTATGVAPSPKLDAFAVGMTLLRLAVPALHAAWAMERARGAMDAIAGDAGQGESTLSAWRQSEGAVDSCDFSILEVSGAWPVIEGLLEWDPEKRMTLDEALACEYFRGME
ncbi:protein kinase [bacterium]|nr:protein kinase [bacterium]